MFASSCLCDIFRERFGSWKSRLDFEQSGRLDACQGPDWNFIKFAATKSSTARWIFLINLPHNNEMAHRDAHTQTPRQIHRHTNTIHWLFSVIQRRKTIWKHWNRIMLSYRSCDLRRNFAMLHQSSKITRKWIQVVTSTGVLCIDALVPFSSSFAFNGYANVFVFSICKSLANSCAQQMLMAEMAVFRGYYIKENRFGAAVVSPSQIVNKTKSPKIDQSGTHIDRFNLGIVIRLDLWQKDRRESAYWQ